MRQVFERKKQADVAKLVDARDLKSLGEICTGSTPVVRTIPETGCLDQLELEYVTSR
jgi:hypothetical protein